MKKSVEYWVEYNFVVNEFTGKIVPNDIRSFRKEADANEFAKTTKDGKVVEVFWEQF